MTYNRFEEVSVDNPLPCEEVEGESYTRFQPISATNPYPVMVCDEEAYSRFNPISETNPFPIALDDGSYTLFEPLSEANRLPVVLVEGQSYSPGAEVSMTNPLPVIDTTAVAYTGPLDLVPGAAWKVAYGQRAMSAAFVGQPIYTIKRSSDSQTLVVNSESDGTIDTAAITTFLGGSNPTVVSWNDHSGNGMDTVGECPWIANGQGSRPAVVRAPEQTIFVSTESVSFASGAATLFIVGRADAVINLSGDDGHVDIDCGSFAVIEMSDNNASSTAGGDYAGFADDDTTYLFEVAVEYENNSFRLNGTLLPENNDFDSFGPIGVITGLHTALGPGGSVNGRIQECIVADGFMSDADRLLVRQNIAAYYGITLS